MLHRWGVERLVYLFLSELGSLNALLAQAIYLVEPFMPSGRAVKNLHALCVLLEDTSQQERFLSLLEEQGRVAT